MGLKKRKPQFEDDINKSEEEFDESEEQLDEDGYIIEDDDDDDEDWEYDEPKPSLLKRLNPKNINLWNIKSTTLSAPKLIFGILGVLLIAGILTIGGSKILKKHNPQEQFRQKLGAVINPSNASWDYIFTNDKYSFDGELIVSEVGNAELSLDLTNSASTDARVLLNSGKVMVDAATVKTLATVTSGGAVDTSDVTDQWAMFQDMLELLYGTEERKLFQTWIPKASADQRDAKEAIRNAIAAAVKNSSKSNFTSKDGVITWHVSDEELNGLFNEAVNGIIKVDYFKGRIIAAKDWKREWSSKVKSATVTVSDDTLIVDLAIDDEPIHLEMTRKETRPVARAKSTIDKAELSELITKWIDDMGKLIEETDAAKEDEAKEDEGEETPESQETASENGEVEAEETTEADASTEPETSTDQSTTESE